MRHILVWPVNYENMLFIKESCDLLFRALYHVSGEGLVAAIAQSFHMEFGKIKVGFDCAVVLFGMASSFILMQQLEGIREGTLASAVLVGCLVRFFNERLPFFDRWLGRETVEKSKVMAT